NICEKNNTVKKIAYLSILVLGLTACQGADESTKPEDVDVAMGESYGPVKVNTDEAISVKELLVDYAGKTEPKEYTFEGKISEVCSKAGCWVNIDKGNGETFMVRFKDHFTIPIETKQGSEAYLHGIAYWDT